MWSVIERVVATETCCFACLSRILSVVESVAVVALGAVGERW